MRLSRLVRVCRSRSCAPTIGSRVLRSGDTLECRADFLIFMFLFFVVAIDAGGQRIVFGSMQMATPCSSWITHEVSLVKINRAHRARVDRKDRILILRTHRKGEQGAHSHLTPMKLANCQLTFCTRRAWATNARSRRFAVADLSDRYLLFCYDMVIDNSSLRSCPLEAGESGFQTDG